MNDMTTLRYRVDTQLARLLAEGYRSSEAALKELVDNVGDADAETVRFTLPTPMIQGPIVIDLYSLPDFVIPQRYTKSESQRFLHLSYAITNCIGSEYTYRVQPVSPDPLSA